MMGLIQGKCGFLRGMKPAALKPRPASADIKRRAPATSTSRDWDSTVHDLGEYRLSEKQLQAKVQARHASSKVSRFMRFLFLLRVQHAVAVFCLIPRRLTTIPLRNYRSGRRCSARRTRALHPPAAGAASMRSFAA